MRPGSELLLVELDEVAYTGFLEDLETDTRVLRSVHRQALELIRIRRHMPDVPAGFEPALEDEERRDRLAENRSRASCRAFVAHEVAQGEALAQPDREGKSSWASPRDSTTVPVAKSSSRTACTRSSSDVGLMARAVPHAIGKRLGRDAVRLWAGRSTMTFGQASAPFSSDGRASPW